MKKNLILMVLFVTTLGLSAQQNKNEILQNLESNNQNNQQQTATLKSASRLFADKDDITSVILIVPSGSSVSIIDGDSSYYHVVYNNNEGFIFKRDAVIDLPQANNLRAARKQLYDNTASQIDQNYQNDRFSYLQNKYGSSMATLLNAGKIWKGMTSELVRDSWGEPAKINKSFEGNLVREEWIYQKTWLHLENGVLTDWGPVKK